MSQNMAERRAEAGLETELLVFPDAGHALIGDGQNPIVLLYEGDEARPILGKAQSKTWQTTLDFFDKALKAERADWLRRSWACGYRRFRST